MKLSTATVKNNGVSPLFSLIGFPTSTDDDLQTMSPKQIMPVEMILIASIVQQKWNVATTVLAAQIVRING